MLNKSAVANSLAATTGIVYIVFYILWTAMPEAFKFLFNAQFFGADIAKSIPRGLSMTDFVGTLITMVVLTWVVGYLWAWLHNWFYKKS